MTALMLSPQEGAGIANAKIIGRRSGKGIIMNIVTNLEVLARKWPDEQFLKCIVNEVTPGMEWKKGERYDE